MEGNCIILSALENMELRKGTSTIEKECVQLLFFKYLSLPEITQNIKVEGRAGVKSHKYFSVIFALSFAIILALYLAICKFLR